MRRLVIAAVLMLAGQSICLGGQQSGDGWLRVGGISQPRGAIHFVLVLADRISDRSVYMDAVVDLCSDDPRPICQILYWDKGNLIPAALPLSDAQAVAVLAKYWRNDANGLRSLDPWRSDVRWK